MCVGLTQRARGLPHSPALGGGHGASSRNATPRWRTRSCRPVAATCWRIPVPSGRRAGGEGADSSSPFFFFWHPKPFSFSSQRKRKWVWPPRREARPLPGAGKHYPRAGRRTPLPVAGKHYPPPGGRPSPAKRPELCVFVKIAKNPSEILRKRPKTPPCGTNFHPSA